MTIISADGQDVQPIEEQRFLISVAETYDVLIQVPDEGAYEFRATAQDSSAYTSIWLGEGERHYAPNVPFPNLYDTMGVNIKQIFALTPAGSMGMPDSAVKAGLFDQPGMTMDHGAMDMGSDMDHGSMDMGSDMDHGSMDMGSDMDHGSMDMGSGMDHGSMDMDSGMSNGSTMDMDHSKHSMHEMTSLEQAKDTDTMVFIHQIRSDMDGKRFSTNFRPMASDISSAGSLASDGVDPRRPWPLYSKLRAIAPTVFSKDKPVREIRLTLDGDMERYVWSLNNKTLSESDTIDIKKGEVVRFIMINRTMMHHPMHLHGHFFRVINEQGDYSPLKHTVDVAPMSTTVIEFYADELGDWFFHCHLLYHMKAGMANVVHYEDYTPDPQVAAIRSDLYKDPWYFWGQANALSNMTDGFLMLSNTRNFVTLEWEAGWQGVDNTEWEALLTWDRYVNRFFSVFIGANMGNEIERDRAVLGFRYLLPLNIEALSFVGSDGSYRGALGKNLILTPRLSLLSQVVYDTTRIIESRWEADIRLSYILSQYVALSVGWNNDFGVGAGISVLL